MTREQKIDAAVLAVLGSHCQYFLAVWRAGEYGSSKVAADILAGYVAEVRREFAKL